MANLRAFQKLPGKISLSLSITKARVTLYTIVCHNYVDNKWKIQKTKELSANEFIKFLNHFTVQHIVCLKMFDNQQVLCEAN